MQPTSLERKCRLHDIQFLRHQANSDKYLLGNNCRNSLRWYVKPALDICEIELTHCNDKYKSKYQQLRSFRSRPTRYNAPEAARFDISICFQIRFTLFLLSQKSLEPKHTLLLFGCRAAGILHASLGHFLETALHAAAGWA